MKTEASISAKAVSEIQKHLSLAVIYLEDGARQSSLAHIVAAHRVSKGLPVPKGREFWLLATRTHEVHSED